MSLLINCNLLKDYAEKSHNYCTSSPREREREGDYPTSLQPIIHKLHCYTEEHHLCVEKQLTWCRHFDPRQCSEGCCKLSVLGIGIWKGKPSEKVVYTHVLPEVRIWAPQLEANTCCCDWLLLLQDPGAASMTARLRIIQTQNNLLPIEHLC